MDYYHLYCTDEEIEASRGGGTRPPSQVLCVQVQSWDRNPGSRLLGHAPSPTLGSSLVSGSLHNKSMNPREETLKQETQFYSESQTNALKWPSCWDLDAKFFYRVREREAMSN